MTMRIFFTSSLMKSTSSLSDLSVDWQQRDKKVIVAGTSPFLSLSGSGRSHLLHQPLQLVGELAEVAGGNESEATLLQAVASQFNDLVVSEAQHAVGQRENALGGAAADDVLDPLLHLSRGLQGGQSQSGASGLLAWIGTRGDRGDGGGSLPWESAPCTHDSSL